MAKRPVVVVRGEATLEVPPELAQFSVTVSARDKERQATLALLAERAAALRAKLDEHAEVIEKRETSGVQLRSELHKRGGERVRAYAGSVSTQVTVSDFGRLGDLLLALADDEQVAVSGPWWRLRPGSKAGAEVRSEAIREALQRAHEYAAAVGARVERLVEIADEGAGGHGPMLRSAFLAGGDPGAELELDLDPQQQTVSASVLVKVTITEPRLPEAQKY